MDVLYTEELREHNTSWLNDITGDQVRINDWLLSQVNKQHNILFVGIGNSSLAIETSNLVNLIDGITIIRPEYNLGVECNLPNYTPYYMDKYSDELAELPNKYDFITDNNIASYAKDMDRFIKMMNNYLNLLRPQGKIISHTGGLSYVYEGSGVKITSLENLNEVFNTYISDSLIITLETDTVFSISKPN